MGLIRGLALVLAGALLALWAASANAQTQYAWELASATTEAMGQGDTYEWYPANENNGDSKKIVVFFGRNTTPNPGYGLYAGRQLYTCGNSICALGVFVYTKNTVTFQSGTGLTFSDSSGGIIRDYDVSPITAFGYSSLALMAQVSGFLAEPVVRGLTVALIVLTMGPMLARKLWGIARRETEDATDTERIDNDKASNKIDGDTLD